MVLAELWRPGGNRRNLRHFLRAHDIDCDRVAVLVWAEFMRLRFEREQCTFWCIVSFGKPSTRRSRSSTPISRSSPKERFRLRRIRIMATNPQTSASSRSGEKPQRNRNERNMNKQVNRSANGQWMPGQTGNAAGGPRGGSENSWQSRRRLEPGIKAPSSEEAAARGSCPVFENTSNRL